MKRPTASPVKGKGSWTCADKAFASKYPTIASFMCDGWWDDGKPRELATISINFSQDLPTVGLADHCLNRSCYTTAASVQEALDLLEEALHSGTVAWRSWKAQKGR